jgi:mycothiol synthase
VIDLRPPTRDDAVAVAEASLRFGLSDETAQDVESWFDLPSTNLERDARVAVRDGSIIGYGDVGDRTGDGKVLWLDIRAEDDALPQLLDFLEARAADLASEGAKAKVWSPEGNERLRSLIESRGYGFDHYSRRMRVALDADLPDAKWPNGVSVRTYRRDEDEEAVYEAHQDAFSGERDFERDPFDEWTHWSYREPFDPELWFLAVDGEEIAGISLCRPERGGDESVGWISVLGVRRPWRRRGLGTALLRHSFREFHERGKQVAALGVDADNQHALALYERAGMQTERSFVWYERAV